MENNDIEQLKQNIDIVDVVSKVVDLKKEGPNYIGLCPFHTEKTPSFKVNSEKQIYKCFGCNAGGDVIKFIMDHEGLDFKAAIKRLDVNKILKPTYKKEDWVDVVPIPDDAKNKPDKCGEYTIKKYYPYYTEDKELKGYGCLGFKPDGKKGVLPLVYVKAGDKYRWMFRMFKSGHSIYGLEDLKDDNAKILMVEGEKCRDAAAEIFKDVKNIIPISWIGGSQNATKVDWTPIKGRSVIYWPDADSQRYNNGHNKGKLMGILDQPGTKCMIQINKKIGGKSKIIRHSDDKINGWDIADAIESGWDIKKIKKYIVENIVDFEEIYPKEENKKNTHGEPFQYLGYGSAMNTLYYYYLPNGTNKIVELCPSAHSKMNLLGLAPIQYWEREYPGKTQPDYTAAANDLMRQCENVGIYDPFRVRGRGAWFDDKRVVLHMGNKLIVDNKEYGVADIDSGYIYESGLPIEYGDYKHPLKVEESKKLLEICKLLSWKNNIDARLLAGWLAIAHIGGAIDWRPHVWITGESGTGKSWIYDHIITPLLGRFSLNLSSNSTEAGIRGTLGNDAMPVFKDENEAETKEAMIILTRILELVRQASSNKESKIVKGTATGGSIAYCIRSPFLFTSINAKLTQQSDESRFSILKLIKRKDYAEGSTFRDLQALVVNTINDKWCGKLRARSAAMIPVIRENINIFVTEVAQKLMSNRHGEQIGTLLAGCYSLISDDIVTKAQCKKIINSINLSEEADIKYTTDQEKLLFTICEQLIMEDTTKEHSSVGSLIRTAGIEIDGEDTDEDSNINRKRRADALRSLRKYGISVVRSRSDLEDGREIVFAEKHSKLESLLRNTAWEKGYSLVLSRFAGAKIKKASFSGGIKYRSIAIPYKRVFTEHDDDDSII